MREIGELIERVDKLDGPDRGADDQIKIAVAGYMIAAGRDRDTVINAVEGNLFDPSPEFTHSLDAVLSLTLAALPGWTIAGLGQDDKRLWRAELRQGYRTAYSTVSLAGHALPAIALCLALLHALDAAPPPEGGK